MNKAKKTINWLAILRGITILLVVANHVRLLDPVTDECYSFIFDINNVFKPLRMPTFVMVSGMLLYHTRIRKNWKILDLYKDKIKRIGLPLCFCTILGNLMQIIFNAFVKNPHAVNLLSFFQSFFLYDGFPWPHRWYLMVLLLMMLLYPLYTMKVSKATDIAMLIGLFILGQFYFGENVGHNWCYIYSLNIYLPYFFLGIMIFKYEWWKVLDSYAAAVSLTVLYLSLYVFGICGSTFELLDSFIPISNLLGVAMMISICIQIAKIYPSCCKSFRNYIFQIYLFGIVFQAFVELILWRNLGCPTNFVALFYILNVAVGVICPVIMSKIIERIPNRWVRLSFGLN